MKPSTILLIDDDDLFRKALRLMLERKGHTVVEAVEGGDGMRCFKAGTFDLVITDLIMPGKEGLETIRELRTLQPTVKIIAMSGGGRVNAHDYLPMARAFGAARVMDKPFSEEELVQALEAVLGN